MTRAHVRSLRASAWATAALVLVGVEAAFGRPQEMHIMEGFLPPGWAAFWFAIAIPFWLLGFRRIKSLVDQRPEARLGLGLSGAFCLVLSAFRVPSVTGSSSHPTGTGLGAILFGPLVMSVLGSIVLLFQALLLAHGGITTLGANAVSMAVVGPAVGWGVYAAIKVRPVWLPIFLAGTMADLSTYLVTSAQLAVAYPDPVGGIAASMAKFVGIFAFTQVPIAVGDGILTVLIVNALRTSGIEEMASLGVREV